MTACCTLCNVALIRPPGAIDFLCPQCNNAYAVCSECDAVNPPGRRYCSQCGLATVRICTACQHLNWAGDEQCSRCDKPLDILETLSQPSVRRAHARLLSQQEQAMSIKRLEAEQADSRMAHFQRLENQRQLELGRTQQEEKKRERQMIIMILFLTALLILSIIILTMFWASKAT